MEDVYVEVETETNQRNIINFCISKLSNIDREIVGYWRAGVSYRDVAIYYRLVSKTLDKGLTGLKVY